MSHFRRSRSARPDITDTYSLRLCNITFRTTEDDLFPLFDKYGKVVDIFIPRNPRSGSSRGYAFVRYKYADEAQEAMERLYGTVVDGRAITVSFAKYGKNSEPITMGKIVATSPRGSKPRSRSPPRRKSRDDYRDEDCRERSRSGSVDRDHRRWSMSRSASPDYSGGRGGGGRCDDERRGGSWSMGRFATSMLVFVLLTLCFVVLLVMSY